MVAGELERSGLAPDVLKVKSTRCHLRLKVGILVSNAAITKHHNRGGFKECKLTIL